MGLGNSSHQSDGEDDDVLLAVGEGVLRAREGAFEEATVAQEMRFSGLLYLKPVVSDDCFNR